MEYRIMNEKEFELSKELWLECFPEDDKAFVDWYYTDRTRPEYALGAFCEGEESPVAMLHMLPMKMRFNGRPTSVCFVAGVCTKPAERGKGLCSALFEKAFDIMTEKGFAATVLQPFDTGFYERFGYKTFILRNRVRISAERLNEAVRAYEDADPRPELIAPDPKRLLKLYKASMHSFNGYSIRSESYFNGFIREYSLPYAELKMNEFGCCAGYPCGEDGSVFCATELFFTGERDYLSLLPEGYSEYIFPLPAFCAPPEGSEVRIEEFSMIKPLKASFRFGCAPLYGFDRY